MDLDFGFIRFHDVGTLASWIAAAISATATGLTLWLRRRDRPEAHFYFERAGFELGQRGRVLVQRSFNSDRDHDDCLSMTNVGDGTAHGVVVTSRGCRIRPILVDDEDKRGFITPNLLAKLQPGDSCMLLLWNDPGSEPDDIVVIVEWLNAPTRHNKRSRQQFRRSDIVTTYPGEERYKKPSPPQ